MLHFKTHLLIGQLIGETTMAINETKTTNDFSHLSANISGIEKPVQPEVKAPDFGATASGAAHANFTANVTGTPNSKRGTGLLSGQRRLVPYNQIGARLSAFITEFEKITKEQLIDLEADRKNWEYKIFDGQSNRSAVSAILFIRDYKTHAAIYPWIVQDNDSVLADKVVQIPAMYNQPPVTINLPQLTEELLTSDGTLSQQIVEYVSGLPKYAGKKVFVTGGRVLPTKLEPTNTAQLRSIIFYASDALEHAMYSLDPNREFFSIANKSHNESLVAKMEFNPGLSATAVGFPVRNDLSVKLNIVERAQKNALSASKQIQFSTTRCFAELIYTGGNAQLAQMQQMAAMNPGMMGMQMPGLNPMFRPAVIISSMDNQFEGGTLETQLLALNSASLLFTNGNWMNLFRPNHAITTMGDDPRDIGMITMDVAYPGESLQYSDAKSDTFPFYQFMAKYVERDPLVKLDVAELGDLTYLQRAFLFAGNASDNGSDVIKAQEAICMAANHLTDGHFSKHWDVSMPIVVESDRIETGYFIDDKGDLRPLSEIDYLFLLNKTSVADARNYQDSFNKQMYPDEMVRFSKRKAIYDTYFPGAYEITGYARRLTINSQFIIALSRAMQEAGGQIGIEYSYNNNATIERGYRNQILGVQGDQIAQFTYGNMSTYGNQGQQAGTWRTYHSYGFGPTMY